jgi:hypothetical protein
VSRFQVLQCRSQPVFEVPDAPETAACSDQWATLPGPVPAGSRVHRRLC